MIIAAVEWISLGWTNIALIILIILIIIAAVVPFTVVSMSVLAELVCHGILRFILAADMLCLRGNHL